MAEINKKQKVVAVSGYFNPVHRGHINLFKAARALGDKLVVILNNDEQVKLKGSCPFMAQKDRKAVLEAIECISEVVISIDADRTVCKTLELIKPDIFANGGDRREALDIPETEVCKQYNIEMVFNVGGGKATSSSWLIDKAKGNVLNKEIPEDKLKKLKMIVLDSDGVCVERGTNIREMEDNSSYRIELSSNMLSLDLAEKLNRLKKHLIVCISSGRSLMYLQTLYSRVLGGKSILMAENGNIILAKGKISQLFCYDDRYFEKLALIRNNLKHLDISGFEPKQFILTAHAQKEVKEVYGIVEKIDQENDLRIMWNGEAFDIQRKDISKGEGLKKIIETIGFEKENIIAIGDRLNDKELLDEAGVAVSADIEKLKAEYFTKGERLPAETLVQYLLDYFENR
ncbi:HAD-IIB family hydrolase [Candidatus Parcubacteria bacterium]|nr:HAD-IIB family hydrolase [Candidatus Parcubacteria bacterium]